jgi:hypothetical protein
MQEVIASKYIIMMHMPGADNPANTLSKHWAYQAVYLILKPILFFLGNTANLVIQYDDTFFRYPRWDYLFCILYSVL